MAVFDNITRHLDLSKSVKTLVYDSAQFFNFRSAATYFSELCLLHGNGAYLHLGSANTEITEFQKYIHRNAVNNADSEMVPEALTSWCLNKDIDAEISSDPFRPPRSSLSADESNRHQEIIEGFLRYSLHRQEHGNILQPSWFNRVVCGLMSICALETVAMRNTWNDIYEEEEIDKMYQDQHVDNAGDRDHPLNYRDLRACIVPVNLDDPNMDNLVNSGRIMSDGRRLRGSPSARAYKPTGLLPFSPKPGYPTPHTRRLPESELFDGRLESTGLVELLYAS
ncbi:MAG: hypothetical protein Q9180_008087, partial [Flavoplaca navasiana]